MRLVHLAFFLFSLAGGAVLAASEGTAACRVAFDVGSSGIRAGSNDRVQTARVDIDYLSPLWAGRGLTETQAPTVSALRDLPDVKSRECARVAGGFSAWRLALETRPGETIDLLARIQADSGVALLVIPQLVEGGYGAYGARQQLGSRLTSSHVLDIGGGSLQIAGEHQSYGEALGQKVWHRWLCQALRHSEGPVCALQPMSDADLALVRRLADERLQGVRRALPEAVTMTAISRPVTRGVQPALVRLAGLPAESPVSLTVLSGVIDRVAGLLPEATAAATGTAVERAAWLFSDMLLVEGLLRATHADRLPVAEIDLTNVPGLLADERAFAWGEHYGCYLERLRAMGEKAYASDPATCPAEIAGPGH